MSDSEVNRLISDLQHENSDVRSKAAQELGNIGDTKATLPLISVLMKDDRISRAYAAEALGKIGDNRAVEPLIWQLKNNASYIVQAAAAEALGNIGDEISLDALAECFKQHEADYDYFNGNYNCAVVETKFDMGAASVAESAKEAIEKIKARETYME